MYFEQGKFLSCFSQIINIDFFFSHLKVSSWNENFNIIVSKTGNIWHVMSIKTTQKYKDFQFLFILNSNCLQFLSVLFIRTYESIIQLYIHIQQNSKICYHHLKITACCCRIVVVVVIIVVTAHYSSCFLNRISNI